MAMSKARHKLASEKELEGTYTKLWRIAGNTPKGQQITSETIL